MGIRIGVIDYERPSRQVSAEDVRQILAVGGKDVIRLAWASLNPAGNNSVKHDALAVWFCEFFNMKHNKGNGSACIRILRSMDLLHGDTWVSPTFEV